MSDARGFDFGRAALALLAALSLDACRDRTAAKERGDQAQREIAAPSFEGDVLPVLIGHCSTDEGCHGNKPTHSVALDLRRDAAYRQLVGAAAEARKGALRVQPGDPAASFLVDKLEGRLRPGEGKAMPIDPQTGAPSSPSPLPPAFVDTVLKRWIEAGAANN